MRHSPTCSAFLLFVLSLGAVPSLSQAQQGRPAPNCVGLSSAEAVSRLGQIGWRSEMRSAGPPPVVQQQDTVAFQAPPAGTPSPAQASLILWIYEAAQVPAAPLAAPDCSRWPGSTFDSASGACRCADGQWWRLDGDGCATREEAATQFCSKEWPGSVPAWAASGTFQCECPPGLYWDEEARSCGAARADAAADCAERWPGTTPVFSPGATAYECICAGGTRWEESRSRCQDFSQPSVASVPVPPAAQASPPSVMQGMQQQRVPAPEEQLAPPTAPQAQEQGQDNDENGGAAASPPAGSAGSAGGGSGCDDLLSEIRGRARAGQGREADALALRAATRGCDPGAISEAVKGGADPGAAAAPQPPPPAPRQRSSTRY